MEQINDEIRQACRDALSELRQSMPNFRSRKGQLEMIAAVANTIGGKSCTKQDQHRLLCIEGGTGVGKSLAYLLPSLIVAQHFNRDREQTEQGPLSVVVATHNLSLQMQLLNKEVPMLAKAGLNVEAALLAGRGRYLCERNARNLVQSGHVAVDLLGNVSDNTHPDDLEQAGEMLEAYQSGKWDGLRDSWPGRAPLQRLWRKLQCEFNTCSNSACPHFNSCCFHKSRRQAAKADLVVTNQAMVFADLEQNTVLPEPENMILILDEGHHIRDGYRDTQLCTVNLSPWLKLCRTPDAEIASLNQMALASSLQDNQLFTALSRPLLKAQIPMETLARDCEYLVPLNANDPQGAATSRFYHGKAPENLALLMSSLLSHIKVVGDHLDEVTESLRERIKEEGGDNQADEALLTKLMPLLVLTSNTLECFERMTRTEGATQAKWLANSRNGITLNVSPIEVGHGLAASLWSKVHSAVITSATLTTCGSFQRLATTLGLGGFPTTQYQKIASPFDYVNRSRLIVPPGLPEPSVHAEAQHSEALTRDFLVRMESHRAGLLLFASKRQLRTCAEMLAPVLGEALLNQYDFTMAELLTEHRNRVRLGQRSVLIGTHSLSEGLSLEERELTLLGIAKVPFPLLTSPVLEAEAEAIKCGGGNDFEQMMLPEGSLALTQMVGRLIRTERCWGDVVLYDSRIISKRYGEQLLSNLPPMPRWQLDPWASSGNSSSCVA